ncbi:ABC transporter substrate-binding protein [Cohnella caldifontis]|uniref:ABC transporter substrate-binding protein n=1 Tax=Cohnella caldifontis TaxID=3027471 RepID=UPI0023EB8B68|nr:ABC transporter substrate-binding protein [Cohnella sp. YIM B05605]
MNKKSVFSLVLTALLVGGALLSGCSKSSSEGGAESKPAAGAPSASGSAQPSASPAAQGGTLRIIASFDATAIGYNPEIRSISDFMISATALEALGRYDRDAKLVPFLADSWQTDADAKTITIKLKPGIKFTDGTDFNAAVVQWNLEQYRLSNKPVFNEKDTKSIEAVDDSTVRINLNTWDIGLLDAVLVIQMSSPSAFEKNGKEWATTHPVGTGPFVLDDWQKDVSVKFKKNENYWQKGMPYLDAVEWKIIGDPQTAEAALQAKEADAYFGASPQAAKNLAGSFQVVNLENGNGSAGPTIYIAGDDASSPWSNVKVRQALSYAIDRQALVDSLNFGYGMPTNQYGIPGTWSYNDEVKIGYDPDKAKQLLSEAGYGNGFKTELTFANGPDAVQLYTAVQAYLAKVGIDVQLVPVENAKFREISGAKGSWKGLLGYVFRVDTDPSFNMIRNFASFGTNTRSSAHVAEFDDLLKQSRTVADFDAKKAATMTLQKKAFDEYALAVPLYVNSALTIQSKQVHDAGMDTTYMVSWTPETAKLDK